MKKHLPVTGVGPIYVAVIIMTTVLGAVLQALKVIPVAELPCLELPQKILGAVLTAAGIILWYRAVIVNKIGDCILSNRLLTTGVYSWVRNPIYTAFLFWTCAGILWCNNLLLWSLGLCHWLFLTVLMKHTEEVWLGNLYGSLYQDYCRRVNRCIPWFPKK